MPIVGTIDQTIPSNDFLFEVTKLTQIPAFQDIRAMKRVVFVMKDGVVVKDGLF